MGSSWVGPPQDHRPAVHRHGPSCPTLPELRDVFGGRWDILELSRGSLLAVPRPREDGVSWQMVVSADELAGFGDRLAEADRAMKEST